MIVAFTPVDLELAAIQPDGDAALGEPPYTRSDRRSARSRAACPGNPRAAFPHPHAKLLGPASLDEFHVGAEREPRMVFDGGTESRDRRLFRIFHEQHA